MKHALPILVLLAGSVSVPQPSTEAITPRVASSKIEFSGVIEPPPSPPDILLHFTYSVQFTHWCLESSTNLINWENRDDYQVDTNGIFNLAKDPNKPQEFYRVAGDTI